MVMGCKIHDNKIESTTIHPILLDCFQSYKDIPVDVSTATSSKHNTPLR
jgi:hypothetical protein